MAVDNIARALALNAGSGGGTSVEANPTSYPQDAPELEIIKVGENYYKIPEGGGTLPTITITSEQMLSVNKAQLTPSQSNLLDDDAIAVYYISLPDGTEGYAYKNDKTTLYVIFLTNYKWILSKILFDPSEETIEINGHYQSLSLTALRINDDDKVEITYEDEIGEAGELESVDKVLVATREQTFTAAEKAQLWTNLGLENLDEEDF